MKRRRHPENELQIAVVSHLRMRGVPNLVFLHPANGGYRTIYEATLFKRMGVRAGASDLILLHAGKFYALELKVEGRSATDSQNEFIAAVEAAGGTGFVAVGLDAAIRKLEEWKLLKGLM